MFALARRVCAECALGPAIALSVGLALGASGCGGEGGARKQAPLGPRYRPGDSLSATRLCRCQVCHPPGCCGGAEEPASSCDDDAATEDGDTLAFTEECSLGVGSCAGQCTEEVWRAPKEVLCADYAPPDCCMPPRD